MDIRAYLAKQKETIARQSRSIRDVRVFDFNHVPEEPVMRDECRELIDALLRFDATSVPTHTAIIGSRGSGKTLFMRYLQRLLPPQTDLDLIYANCRHENTSYRIFSHLIGAKCAGASLGDLFRRFQGCFPGKTVIVLDEVDLMSPKDKRREILYLLSRCERPYMIVMLSNSPQVLKQMDAATRSSVQPMPLHFRNYDAEQIRQILVDRAERGLAEWDAAVLAKIAALTVRQTNADARVAIKTLYYAVTSPNDELEPAFDRARRDIVIDLVNDLSDANLMIMWASATAKSDLAKAVYQRYCRFSHDSGDKPFSYVHFYSNLSYLQSMGLIALATTKLERAYTNRILVNCERTTIESLAELRFS